MKVWLKFARSEQLRFVAHLDAYRAYYRLLRRAAVPLKFSEGYNPHPQMSLAVPLPFGIASSSDYLDLSLEREMDLQDLSYSISGASGSESLHLLGQAIVRRSARPLAGLVTKAGYSIVVGAAPDVLAEACSRFLASSALPFIKQTKRREVELDACLLVSELNCQGSRLSARLSMTEGAVLRPDEFLRILSGLASEPINPLHIERKELFIGDPPLTPLVWARQESDTSE